MSITPAPAALRDEVAFIFLFRDLAETIDIETDPKLKQLAAAQDDADAAPPPAPRRSAQEAAPGPRRPRRVLLALHYTAPADLARGAIQALADRHQTDGAFVRLETADDVPEVLLDRQQVTEALTIVLSSVLEACPDPADVRVRLTRMEAPDGPSGHRPPPCASRSPTPRSSPTGTSGPTPGGRRAARAADGLRDRGEAPRGERRPADPPRPRRRRARAGHPAARGPLRRRPGEALWPANDPEAAVDPGAKGHGPLVASRARVQVTVPERRATGRARAPRRGCARG